MRNLLLLILFPLLLIGYNEDNADKRKPSVNTGTAAEVIGCAPNITEADSTTAGKFMIALPGWGKHHYTISTKSDSAQFYFNQGLSLYYSYHYREANASFKEAARLDPACAVAYWG